MAPGSQPGSLKEASIEPKAEALLGYIRCYIRQHEGVAPSYPEMMKAVDVRYKAGMHRLMRVLEANRRIRTLPHRARAIEVIDEPAHRVPLVDMRGPGYKHWVWDNEDKQLIELQRKNALEGESA